MGRLFTLLFLLLCGICRGQVVLDLQCDNRDKHAIYLVCINDGFYRMDSVDMGAPSDPKKLMTDPIGAGGISINANLDSAAGPTTMYFTEVVNNEYYFWNGIKWQNSHHNIGGFNAYNPGGTNQYIFNLDGGANEVWRYNGKGAATLLAGNLGTINQSVFDIATDKQGNFYIFYCTLNRVVMFDSGGIAVDTFTTSGNPTISAPGFAILGNRMYEVVSNTLYEGIVSGHNIVFTPIRTFAMASSITDIAACPTAGEVLSTYRYPEAPHFAVYPNPAMDKAEVRLNNATQLKVTDCLGRTKLVTDTQGLTQYTLPVSEWATGMYWVTVVSPAGQRATAKLVVR